MENGNKKYVAMLLYTDGSCGPQMPGYLGMGYHGYFYEKDAIKTKSGDIPSTGYPSKLGYIGADNEATIKESPEHIRVAPLGYLDGYYSDGTTLGFSNDAERLAIEYALQAVGDYFQNNEDTELIKLSLFSDSQVALIIYSRAYKFLTNHPEMLSLNEEELLKSISKELPTLSPSTVKHISTAMVILKEFVNRIPNVKIDFHKVAGHSGNIGNELADMLAVTIRKNASIINQPILGSNWTLDKYWKPNVDRHPLLRYRELFFMHNGIDFNNFNGYFTVMNYKTNMEVGTRSADPLFGLVYLSNTPKQVIDLAKNYSGIYKNQPILLYAMDLDKLYKPANQTYFNQLGENSVTTNKQNQLVFMDRDPIVYPVYPPSMAKKVYDQTMSYKTLLEQAKLDIEDKKFRQPGKIYIDITDKIFQGEGKKRKCILNNSIKTMKLNVELDDNVKVTNTIVFNTDIIDRNHFKQMETDNVNVYVMYLRQGKQYYNYYTLVFNHTTKCYGIYCNIFSSKIFIEDPSKPKKDKKENK